VNEGHVENSRKVETIVESGVEGCVEDVNEVLPRTSQVILHCIFSFFCTIYIWRRYRILVFFSGFWPMLSFLKILCCADFS
jgi:hypothetical protein